MSYSFMMGSYDLKMKPLAKINHYESDDTTLNSFVFQRISEITVLPVDTKDNLNS